jgi:hypothetical protein
MYKIYGIRPAIEQLNKMQVALNEFHHHHQQQQQQQDHRHRLTAECQLHSGNKVILSWKLT